jgi:hypothetical protein
MDMDFALAVQHEEYVDLNDIATPALFKSLVSAFPFAPLDQQQPQHQPQQQQLHQQAQLYFQPQCDEMVVPDMEEEDAAALTFRSPSDSGSMYSRSGSPSPSSSGSERPSLAATAPRRRISKRDALDALLPADLAEKMKQHTIARGRRRAKQLATMSTEEREAEAIMIREKNRLSAKECRERKKTMVQTLQARLDDLEAQDRKNQAIIAQLQRLNASLLADLQQLTRQ